MKCHRPVRVVILGGGFGGLATALELEKVLDLLFSKTWCSFKRHAPADA